MTFNSVFFIFLFLPISLLLHFICKPKLLNQIVLVLLSILFYSWLNPSTAVLLILYILLNYFTALEMDSSQDKQRKIAFIFAVALQILILFLYKYLNLFLPSLQLELKVPVGLSFFTFSCISYLADVYTKKCEAQKNLISLALYISFFGKISMGPIVPYHKMEEQINHHPFQMDVFCNGIKLFCIGLTKKAILADSLSLLHTNLASSQSVVGAWLFALSYMLQIYFDFSGYSDMAIGIGNLFGFQFEPNFNHPYNATSIQDFWRRWHISLSQWFRDYVYIPLGGSRVSNIKIVRNILIVWILTGLWHGSNWTFIVWGLYFGILLLIERFFLKEILEKCPKIIRRIYTLFLVLISWIFFMSENLTSAFICIGHLFGVNASFVDATSLFYLRGNLLLLVVSLLLSFPLYSKLEHKILSSLKQKGSLCMAIVYVILFLIGIAFVISNTFQSFLYFAF